MATVFDDLDTETTTSDEPQCEYEYLVGDVEMLAKYYIDLYFRDKELPKGVTKKLLHSKKYTSMVLNLDICTGIDSIYKLVGVEYTNEQMRYFERQGQLPDDVKYVISMLHDCSKRGIPKQFAVGVIVMYLELCEGHKLTA